MMDRSARGLTARGFLPLVFALVFSTGCASQDSAPEASPPPISQFASPANSKVQPVEHEAPPLALWAKFTNDRLCLASATDIPCEKTADSSPASDSSRRSRIAELADALNSPDDVNNTPSSSSDNTASSEKTASTNNPTCNPFTSEPKPTIIPDAAELAVRPDSDLHSSNPTSPDVFKLTPEPVEKTVPLATSQPEPVTAPVAVEVAAPAPTEPAELSAASSMLPWGPSKVSPEMAAICARAEEAARSGFNLAERGAMYSARAEFIDALRILTEALDAQHNTNAHTRALNAGLRALQEVNDFVPPTGQLETDLNFRLLVDSHHTPVLKDSPLDHITALQAQRMYLTYAQEQLAAAGADQPVASLALHGLGKICTVPHEMHGPPEQIAEAKAVVYHQAALMVEPKNFMAANELGVLLAHFGRLPESQSALQHAVAMSGGPTEWQNLAAVCDRLNEPAKAAEARQQAQASVARLQSAGYPAAGMKYPIQWLDPSSFATTNSMVADAAPASPSSLNSVMSKSDSKDSTAPDASTPAVAAKPQPKSGFWSWLK